MSCSFPRHHTATRGIFITAQRFRGHILALFAVIVEVAGLHRIVHRLSPFATTQPSLTLFFQFRFGPRSLKFWKPLRQFWQPSWKRASPAGLREFLLEREKHHFFLVAMTRVVAPRILCSTTLSNPPSLNQLSNSERV